MIGKTVYIGTLHRYQECESSSCANMRCHMGAHNLLHENPHYVVNDPEEFLTIL